MSIDLNNILHDKVLDESTKQFMKNLQANILKGHGREHVALVFLSVNNIDKAREFLHHYKVTDALKQQDEAKRYKQQGTKGEEVRLVFLSKAGLDKFGHGAKFSSFTSFSGGMASDTSVLDDGSTNSWQPALKNSSHVMLLVAHHNEIHLARVVNELLEEVSPEVAAAEKPFEVIFVQEGRGYKNSAKQNIEHFGYVDGRSQPLMTQSAIEEERDKKGGIDKYDPTAPLSQFLIHDPLSSNGYDGYGSFFVFRKLEQDVARFKQSEETLGEETLGLQGDDVERTGAMVVGRFEDGTPVTLQNTESAKNAPVVNNFNYDNDSTGSKCPFHAHIRKSNPRGSNSKGLAFDKSVQMARRGIPYGIRLQHPETKEFIDKPNDGVGLLFMSYQACLDKQFRFMQTQWVNAEDFPQAQTGVDPVIGQGGKTEQTWFPEHDSTTQTKKALFKGFVTLKGGEYFFTPSISGLKSL